MDEIVRNLKKNPGFKAYLIFNNDGIVLRWEQVGNTPMPYHKAVQHAHHVLDLYHKSKMHIRDLFDVSFCRKKNYRECDICETSNSSLFFF